MAEPKMIKEYLTTNVMTTYYELDESMFTAHREERHEFAESTARILLNNSNLPLIIRARACMILGCSVQHDFLDMAKEGVRIAELGYSRCVNPGDFEKQLVADCKTVLQQAQAAADDYASDAEDELVWHASMDQGGSATQTDNDVPMLGDEAPAPVAEGVVTRGVERFDSGVGEEDAPEQSGEPAEQKDALDAVDEGEEFQSKE